MMHDPRRPNATTQSRAAKAAAEAATHASPSAPKGRLTQQYAETCAPTHTLLGCVMGPTPTMSEAGP